MEYVHVISDLRTNKDYLDFELAAIGHCNNILISLIHGLKQKQFGYDTLDSISRKIDEMIITYINSQSKKKLYIDSGGYSFITGDVSFSKTHKFISCYQKYLQKNVKVYDAIFSLDIPVWGGDDNNSTMHNILDYNRESIEQSIKILKGNPEILNKFYFVWQFNKKHLFEIWDELYDELGLQGLIQNRAIGGLVSLTKQTNIDFSPFTEMAMRCYWDHLHGPHSQECFRLHLLGQNRPYHRFQIQLLEAIFHSHSGIKPDLTYDSANYTVSGLYTVRNLNVRYLDDQNELQHIKRINHVPECVIKNIFGTDSLFQAFKRYLVQWDRGDTLTDPYIGVPVNVFSELQVDRYLKIVIDASKLAEHIINDSKAAFTTYASEFLRNYQHILKNKFGGNMYVTVKNDIYRTFRAYQVVKTLQSYQEGKDKLNKLIHSAIKDIRL